ncbi:hypothetical protein Zmor_010881 [Zophobas morio]|uniref:Uncharacterized protein n=1 Tax=Zophobas morio TaxID=2755281 RepID=A0AA38IPJ6_9CUCU|nr:hypothetical protein Zmor_010881 [Zophobas morio]
MQNRLLIRSLLLLLITTCLVLALQSTETARANKLISSQQISRDKRLIFKKKPGFFRTLFSVVFEQWNDTKHTFRNVSRLINDNFAPESAPVMQTTTASSDPNATTTEAPFKLTRTEFNKLLNRNLRGLIRLTNIELQDALKVSEQNYAAFKRNASLEISKFL